MRECLNCKSDISSLQKRNKFCSHVCSAAYRFPKSVKLCCRCQVKFTGRGKFCSQSCAASHNNALRFGREGLRCLGCDIPIQRLGSRVYCLASCRQSHQISLWLKDSFDPTVKSGLSSAFRNWLLKEAGYKCTECNWSRINPVTGKVPLTIDHIDGNYKNNKRSNLKVLCPNCHSLTPTYGALNKGSGRKERYAAVAQ